MNPGGYTNYFSLNLTSGYSGANYFFEAALFSNLNERETRGLQVAGIANVTGGNAFAGMTDKEKDAKVRTGFEANLTGLQASGIANVVLNNVFGSQISGGVNVTKGALLGFQLAGISNTVYKYSFGVQLAGLYNVSAASMDGVQLSGLFNITTNELYGVQIGMINRAAIIQGANSYPATTEPTGVQIGVINVATKKMNGFQIGLINKAGVMQGTQIGLINIFRNGKDPYTRNGTAIGLINAGQVVHLSAYASDLFVGNIEIATGTEKNARVNGENTVRMIMNALIYANDPVFLSDREQWAVGYGIEKMYFNRSTAPGMGYFRFISFGADFLHINRQRGKLTKALNLLIRPNISVGSRLNPRNRHVYVMLIAAYNYLISKTDAYVESIGGSAKTRIAHWPGFGVGVLLR